MGASQHLLVAPQQLMVAPQQQHAGSTAAAYGSNTAVVGSTAAALPRRAMQWWATGRPPPNASGGPPRRCPADIRWPTSYIVSGGGSPVVHQWQIRPSDSRLHVAGGPPVAFWPLPGVMLSGAVAYGSVGTASVSFARGQHLTRSCTPWRAVLTTLSHEAMPTHSFTCDLLREQGGPAVSLLLAAQATRLPPRSTFHHHPGIHLRQCAAKLKL